MVLFILTLLISALTSGFGLWSGLEGGGTGAKAAGFVVRAANPCAVLRGSNLAQLSMTEATSRTTLAQVSGLGFVNVAVVSFQRTMNYSMRAETHSMIGSEYQALAQQAEARHGSMLLRLRQDAAANNGEVPVETLADMQRVSDELSTQLTGLDQKYKSKWQISASTTRYEWLQIPQLCVRASCINGTGHRPHHAGRISSEAD